MKKLSGKEMEKINGGNSSCLLTIAGGALAGSALGGVGAIVGVAVTATSSSCLSWW
jgi:hypothetical protein